jgi:hypothetical protein
MYIFYCLITAFPKAWTCRKQKKLIKSYDQWFCKCTGERISKSRTQKTELFVFELYHIQFIGKHLTVFVYITHMKITQTLIYRGKEKQNSTALKTFQNVVYKVCVNITQFHLLVYAINLVTTIDKNLKLG